MPALAHRHAPLPALRRRHTRLRAVPPPRRRRAPSARAVALYALGLMAGFLLAGAASSPGGAGVVAGQTGLAALAAVAAGLATLRARAVSRRQDRGPHVTTPWTT
jgi:hypothetical protein